MDWLTDYRMMSISRYTRDIVANGGGLSPFMWEFWAMIGVAAIVCVVVFFAGLFVLRSAR